MKYYVWGRNTKDTSYAWIKDFPEEISKQDWKLGEGISCRDWFPMESEVQIYSEKGIKLTDAIPNYSNKLIISKKLRDIFEEKSGAHFEFFPIKVKDKKGRVVDKEYFIANLLDTVDCVDMEKSEYRICSIIKDQVDRFSLLVFDENRIDSSKNIFRLKDQTKLIVITSNFLKVLVDNGIKGPALEPIEKHGSVFRD